MSGKKWIAAAGILLLIIIVYRASSNNESDKKKYLYDKRSNIKFKDIKKDLKKIDFDKERPGKMFSKKVANPYTIKFFKFLGTKFQKKATVEEHLEAVREYLLSIMSPEEAEALFALYKKYLYYEIDMARKLQEWGMPKSADEALEFLRKIHAQQQKVFGKETADILFGANIKAREYPIRRKTIVFDKELYGAEKEKMVKELNKDMWGDEAEAIENAKKPFDRYQEKLNMYQKDFSEMDDASQKAKVAEFRKEYFNEEQIARMEEVDRQLENEEKNEETYNAEAEIIKNDPNLSDEEKSKKIKELQEKVFGDGAEAFRRRANIEKGLEELKNR